MAPTGYPAAFEPLGAGAQRAPRPWEPSPKVPAVGVRRRSQRLEILLVNIAPAPFLVRLERADDRVLSRVEVLGGTSVRRVITTAHMPALGTYSKVNPTSMYLQAVLAPQGAWLHTSHVLWGQVLIHARVLQDTHGKPPIHLIKFCFGRWPAAQGNSFFFRLTTPRSSPRLPTGLARSGSAVVRAGRSRQQDSARPAEPPYLVSLVGAPCRSRRQSGWPGRRSAARATGG